jgi:DNA processing protein
VKRPQFNESSAEELLGHFNEFEKRWALDRLFWAGRHEFLMTGARVSVVGTRKASTEGLQRARKFARLLTERQCVVVSGLARGIDTAAHTAAIESGGRTIGVLGTALSEFYPLENRSLQTQMMLEQLVISQFAQGVRGGPANFPARNRTMALIADATVIIEAEEKSGTQSQAWESLRLNKPVFFSKSLADRGLAWVTKVMEYGGQILQDDALSDLWDSLPLRIERPAAAKVAHACAF